MKVSRIAALTLLGLLGSAATAHAATINYRHEYVPEAGKHKDRVAVSHRLANGVGFGVEAKWQNNAKDESYWDAYNNLESNGSVFTLDYQYKINDRWSLQPGFQLDGSEYQLYTRATYKVTDAFSTSLRYRWRTENVRANSANDKLHRDNLTLNLGYKLTPEITVGYELDYNILGDGYVANKGYGFADKKRTWDHNFTAGYRINKEWEPFVEFGWIQGTKKESSSSYNDTYIPRYRVGVKYNF